MTQLQAREAVRWVRRLEALVECAGNPAASDPDAGCNPADPCTGCAARAWLAALDRTRA